MEDTVTHNRPASPAVPPRDSLAPAAAAPAPDRHPADAHTAEVRAATYQETAETLQPDPAARAALRAVIAQALEEADYRPDMRRGDLADAVLAVLPEQTRCPHGCDTSHCPCLACEAAARPDAPRECAVCHRPADDTHPAICFPPTARDIALAAAEERLAVRRARQAGNAPCMCGHPKNRHTKIRGVLRRCRWYYGRGEGSCHCGEYRPDDTTGATP